MRTEQEMFDLILDFAKEDDRIRIVGMEGSRANPKVEKDKLQDFDISFLVTEIEPFLQDHSWIDVFGKRIIMQMPEAMSLFPNELGNWFSYLMLFDDGNRIDLTLIPIEEKDKYIIEGDGLLKIILDKDNIISNLPEPSDSDYHVSKPTKEHYEDCCNEFLWVTTYVAKGLWRHELIFASHHLNQLIRPCLLQMLEWKVGIDNDFTVSVGKSHKYLQKYISEEEWSSLLETYNACSYETCWDSLYQMCELFKKTAAYVGKKLGYTYPQAENDKVLQYLNKIHLDSFNS